IPASRDKNDLVGKWLTEGLTQLLLPAEDPVYSQGVLSESSLTYLLLHAFGREPNEHSEWSLPCCRAREGRERQLVALPPAQGDMQNGGANHASESVSLYLPPSTEQPAVLKLGTAIDLR